MDRKTGVVVKQGTGNHCDRLALRAEHDFEEEGEALQRHRKDLHRAKVHLKATPIQRTQIRH